jgi:O-antigen/teichoic acid export membrane protein
VAWNYTSFVLGKGLAFLATAVLARLLTPVEFGVVGFATLVVSFLDATRGLGLGAALIQRREDTETIGEVASTAFTLNLGLGVLLTGLAFASAPFVGGFFAEPRVVPLLRVLSLIFVLNALGAMHTVLLQRDLQFSKKLIPDLGRTIVKGVASVGLALAGAGVWALVVGQLAGAFAATVLAWTVCPWRPALGVDRRAARALLAFGSIMSAQEVVAGLWSNVDYLVVGKVLGPTSLGLYTLAYRLPELLVLNVLWVLAAVLFPAYARLQDDPGALRAAFLSTARYILLAVTPVAVGLMISADVVVRVAFGDAWLAAVPAVRLHALFALILSVGFHAGDVYKATGRVDVLLKLGLFHLAVLLPLLLAAAPHGIAAVAAAHVVAAACYRTVDLLVASRMLGIAMRDVVRPVVPSLKGAAALTVLAVPALHLTTGAPDPVRLAVVAAAGAAGYFSFLGYSEREALAYVVTIARSARH